MSSHTGHHSTVTVGFIVPFRNTTGLLMKKLFSLVLLLMLLDLQISFSQQVDFAYGYSSALNRHYATINDMELTSDSMLLLTGTAWYLNGPDEYFIIKADLDGNIVTIIRDDTTGSVGEGQIIKELSNGNYLMVNFRTSYGSSYCPSLMFYTSTGNFLFQNFPYIPPIDTFFSPSGLVEIQSNLYLIGHVYCSANGYDSCVIIKTDLDGNVLQINWFPDLFPTQYHGGIITSHGNILIGGMSSDTVFANRKPQLTCIDTTGLILWQQTYNIGSWYSEVDEICELPYGYLLGLNNISTLIKVDTTGSLIWAEPQSSFSNGQIQLNYAGNYLAIGRLGTVIWSDTLGQPLADYSLGISALEATETLILNDKLYIAGKAWVGSGSEGYLIRISDSLLAGISEDAFVKSKIYPNPVCSGSRFNFSIPAEKITSVTLHDLQGKLIIPTMVIHSEATPFIELPTSLQAGTYLISFNLASTKYIYRLVVMN